MFRLKYTGFRTEQNRTEQNRTEQNVGRRANCVFFAYKKISERMIDHLLDDWTRTRIPVV